MLTNKKPNDSCEFPEEVFTGYQYEGKEIVAVRKVGRPPTYRKNPNYFSMSQKTDAATLYCVYGDMDEVSKLTDVPVKVLREWKQEPWWVEIQKQIYVEQNDKLSSRISGVLETAIEQIVDRLEHGDQTYNPKTGEITRKPIEAKVLTSLFDSLSHQRRVNRGEPTQITAKVQVDDRLKKLEEAFVRFANAKEINPEEVIEDGDETEDGSEEGLRDGGT